MSDDYKQCARCGARAMRLVSQGERGKGEWLCYPHADEKMAEAKEKRGKAQ